jgi:soluble lytic murein transglycosylase-like protein
MTYLSIIANAAKAAKVSAILLAAVCAHESRDFTLDYAMYDNGSPSYSVCQVKEDTARMLGFKGNAMKLRNPYVGIKYAALYLAYQQQRYGDDWVKLTAAYNSGSYNPSNKVKGCPRNLKYLKSVKEELPDYLRYRLDCRERTSFYQD